MTDLQLHNIIGGGGEQFQYVRPSDWLTMPDYSGTHDEIIILHAVFPDTNFVAFTTAVSAGTYTVDWGDGTIQTFTSNAQAQYTYDYNTISPTTYSTVGGYKQVIIKVKPTTNTEKFTSIQLDKRHTQASLQNYSTGFLDVKLKTSINLTTCYFYNFSNNLVTHRLLEKIVWDGTHSISALIGCFQLCMSLKSFEMNTPNTTLTNVSSMFRSCFSLVKMKEFQTPNVTLFSSMFQDCTALIEAPVLNMSSATSTNSMFNGCFSLMTVPQYNTSNVSNFSLMFSNCRSLEEAPELNTSNGVNFQQMFDTCTALIKVPSTLNLTQANNLNSIFQSCTKITNVPVFTLTFPVIVDRMFSGCGALQSIPAINFSNATSFIFTFNGCASLAVVSATGINQTVSFQECKLGRDEIVTIFNNLPTVTAKTINVSGNWGTPLLSPADIAIATGKGWTVTT